MTMFQRRVLGDAISEIDMQADGVFSSSASLCFTYRHEQWDPWFYADSSPSWRMNFAHSDRGRLSVWLRRPYSAFWER